MVFGLQNVFEWNRSCQKNLTLKELEWNVVRYDHLPVWLAELELESVNGIVISLFGSQNVAMEL